MSAAASVLPKIKQTKLKRIKAFSKKPEQIFSLLATNQEGLTTPQAQSRLAQFGLNKLKDQDCCTLGQLILDQFKSVLVLILLAGAVISLLVGELVDAGAILTIILLNAVLGFIQEYKAEQALQDLKKMETLQARVQRDGQWQTLDTTQIVPGDIVKLNQGQKISADARLLSIQSLQVDESMLTGESVAQTKSLQVLAPETNMADRTNMVYAGTLVTRGHGQAVVIRTGMKTEIGRIADEIQKTPQQATPLQKALAKLGKVLALISIAIAVPGLLIGLHRGRDLVEMLMITVSLAVSAIPEGLPIVVTIALALGIKRMTKFNVLVRKLSTAESLGSTDVICTDKTGTITQNKMTVKKVFVPKEGLLAVKQAEPAKLKAITQAGMLCSDAQLDYGDPTEQAILFLGQKLNLAPAKLAQKFERLDELPFASDEKYMAVLVRNQAKTKQQLIIKGAAEKIFELVEAKKQQLKKWQKVNEQLSEQGLRVLAVAQKQVKISKIGKKLAKGANFKFLGLLAMYDPPRKEVAPALKVCHQAGIRVIMITGDHKKTAQAIAQEVGLDSIKAYTGQQLDQMNGQEFKKAVVEANIFARVSPHHKVAILKTLQALGKQVAMTGDGVNDAPAIKRADVGVAVGAGTDLSKGISDMILLDNNFASIAQAIKEGRRIFFNVKKFVRFLLSANFDEILQVLTTIICGLPLSLVPIQILWINLATDSLPALALATDQADPDIMRRKPYDVKREILRGVVPFAVLAGGLGYLFTFGIFYFSLQVLKLPLDYARTVNLSSVVLFEMFLVFSLRSEKSAFKMGLFNNKLLWLSVVTVVLAQVLIVYHPWGNLIFKTVPLRFQDWCLVVGCGSAGFLLIEFIKEVKYFLTKKEGSFYYD